MSTSYAKKKTVFFLKSALLTTVLITSGTRPAGIEGYGEDCPVLQSETALATEERS
jgi:hypothetical protein